MRNTGHLRLPQPGPKARGHRAQKPPIKRVGKLPGWRRKLENQLLSVTGRIHPPSSGEVEAEHPHDTTALPFMPVPTSRIAHSADYLEALHTEPLRLMKEVKQGGLSGMDLTAKPVLLSPADIGRHFELHRACTRCNTSLTKRRREGELHG